MPFVLILLSAFIFIFIEDIELVKDDPLIIWSHSKAFKGFDALKFDEKSLNWLSFDVNDVMTRFAVSLIFYS
jgi:hypothetical protein